jgi:hypothetical protein
MNRTTLFRSLSLGLASLALCTASLAGSIEQDPLSAAQALAASDAQVARDLQAWIHSRDIALLAQADGLITNDMRADAEQYAVARLVEADGLVTAQLREEVETMVVARLAAADGLVVETITLAESVPPTAPAARATLMAAKTR